MNVVFTFSLHSRSIFKIGFDCNEHRPKISSSSSFYSLIKDRYKICKGLMIDSKF